MDKSPDWNSSWAEIDFTRQTPLATGLFSNFLDIVVPRVDPATKTAVEIGCFPGKFIEYVGQKGYVISGIDTYPRVTDIASWAAGRSCRVGSFSQESLERYAATSQEQFDVVLSLGFIEHFNNFCDVIYDHARLCKEGGLVIIGAPNFASPIQRALHRALDEKNLADHVLEAMYPKTWATFLACLGFQIDYAGSIGGFDFWHETPADNPSITVMQNLIPHLSRVSRKSWLTALMPANQAIWRWWGKEPAPFHPRKKPSAWPHFATKSPPIYRARTMRFRRTVSVFCRAYANSGRSTPCYRPPITEAAKRSPKNGATVCRSPRPAGSSATTQQAEETS